MDTLGERLRWARKYKGFTQTSLADTIGVSRGVIFNLEKNITQPQAIVLNAICQTLRLNPKWLLNGEGEPMGGTENFRQSQLLHELMEAAQELSEPEQYFVLDTIKALKTRLR